MKKITNFLPDKNDPKRNGGQAAPGYGDYTFTPRLPMGKDIRLDNTVRAVKLLPYGMCKIRMTVMNKL
ncbi:MAG: hypothetical protein IJW48_04365 [Clostridia bacterium]|nr:hypothetical protein [Clostridia bacterium]